MSWVERDPEERSLGHWGNSAQALDWEGGGLPRIIAQAQRGKRCAQAQYKIPGRGLLSTAQVRGVFLAWGLGLS